MTLWLFTASDLKTFVLPISVFAFFCICSGPPLVSEDTPFSFRIALASAPKVLLWSWTNTLVFDLSNQRRPESVAEDALNKPWRPLPAARITAAQTERLLFLAIPVALMSSYFMGAMEETSYVICMSWMYNDLGGSDHNFLVRNILIAIAYMVWGSGALKVALGGASTLTATTYVWLAVVGVIVFTTIAVQDIKDQEGDRARERRTAPLVLGERVTRLLLATFIVGWSLICPLLWSATLLGVLAYTASGALLGMRIMQGHSKEMDRDSWRLWSYWLVALFALPLGRSVG